MAFPAPSAPDSIFFEVDSFVGATCYSTAATSNILGDATKENALINFIRGNGVIGNYNYVHVYGLESLVSASVFSGATKTKLNNFIDTCNGFGIYVFAVFRQDQQYVDAVMDYFNTQGRNLGFALNEPWWLNNSFSVDGAYKCFVSVKTFLAANYLTLMNAGGLVIYDGASHLNGFVYPDTTVVSGGDEIKQLVQYLPSGFLRHYYIAVTQFTPNLVPSYGALKERIHSIADGGTFEFPVMYHISSETTALNKTCAPDATHNFSGFYLRGQDTLIGGPKIYPFKSTEDVYRMLTIAFAVPPSQAGSPLYFNAEVYAPIVTNKNVKMIGIGYADYSILVSLPIPIVVDPTIVFPCYHTATGSITMRVNGGSGGPYTYLWNTGATTRDVSGLVPGIYYVAISDGTQTVTVSFVVGENSFMVASIAKTGNQLISSVIGGTGPYTYLWSNAATTANINNPAPGLYLLTITDAIGCKRTISFNLLTDDECVIHKARCCAGELGYQYVWQAKNGLIADANLSIIQLGLLQGFIDDLCEYEEEGCLSADDKDLITQKIQSLCKCCGCEENTDVLNP